MFGNRLSKREDEDDEEEKEGENEKARNESPYGAFDAMYFATASARERTCIFSDTRLR